MRPPKTAMPQKPTKTALSPRLISADLLRAGAGGRYFATGKRRFAKGSGGVAAGNWKLETGNLKKHPSSVVRPLSSVFRSPSSLVQHPAPFQAQLHALCAMLFAKEIAPQFLSNGANRARK